MFNNNHTTKHEQLTDNFCKTYSLDVNQLDVNQFLYPPFYNTSIQFLILFISVGKPHFRISQIHVVFT